MALLIKRTFELYHYAKHDLADPRLNDWFLVHSPIAVISIQITYLLLIYEWLPKFMSGRNAYNLKNVIRVYDVFQILASGYLVISAIPIMMELNYMCAEVDYTINPRSMATARLAWLYFMLKIIDMADTVFFVLRKRDRQITFLHIYHHFGVVFISWAGTKYLAGGESLHLGFINSFVHVVMYSYYLFATYSKNRSRILKWKKYVTQLQLLQFVVLLCIYVPKLFITCKFPKVVLLALNIQNTLMIFMFGDFYYKTYVKGTRSEKQKEVKASQ